MVVWRKVPKGQPIILSVKWAELYKHILLNIIPTLSSAPTGGVSINERRCGSQMPIFKKMQIAYSCRPYRSLNASELQLPTTPEYGLSQLGLKGVQQRLEDHMIPVLGMKNPR